jgi:hypothetical protein
MPPELAVAQFNCLQLEKPVVIFSNGRVIEGFAHCAESSRIVLKECSSNDWNSSGAMTHAIRNVPR